MLLNNDDVVEASETMRTMELARLQALGKIDPTPLAPWRTPAFTEIDIELDREKAKEKASARQKAAGVTVFSDASGQWNHLGAAAAALDQDGKIIQSRQICTGSMDYWSVYAAELMAIYYAISLAYEITQKKPEAPSTNHEPATILTDSMSALQAIANSWNKSGQRIIQAILQSARELNTRGIPLRLQWVPGHCDNPGNDTLDRLAKEAVGPDKMHPFQHLLSREKGSIRHKIQEEWEQEWKASKKEGHLRQIDATLPSIRTRRMYGSLPRSRAYLLAQLRTGHSWLATHGRRHGHQRTTSVSVELKEQ
jgi:ribonuclease HI